jgi:hypothetical protein
MPATDADLLADIVAVANRLGKRTVGLLEYRRLGKFDDTTISRRFGSWNKGLHAAGLEISNEIKLSDERLFENVLELWTQFGRQPRRAELSQAPSRVSQSPYSRRFGSWGAALRAFVEWANASEVESPSMTQSSLDKATPRDPSLRVRFRVLQRDRFTCQGCGASPATSLGIELQVDHVRPWSAGGETKLENLQTLCSRCNLGKGALPGHAD